MKNRFASALHGALALSLAGLPALVLAAPTDADMRAMQQRLEALEAQIAQMNKLLAQSQTPPQAAAPVAAAASQAAQAGWGDSPPARLSQADLDKLKQRMARQELKVSRLFNDAYDGPGAGLQVTGYLDPTYVVNRNAKTAGFQFLDGGDPYTYFNSANGEAFLHITKTFGEGALAPKADVEIAQARGYGTTSTNSSGTVVPSIFHVASVAIPIDDKYSFTMGRLAGFSGYEYYESTLTNAVTHNMLYDFSEAGNMTGIGLNITKGDWAWKTFLSNEEYFTAGSSVGAHPNRVPTLAARLDYTASTAMYWGGSMLLGRNTIYGTDNGCDSGYGYQCSNNSGYGNKFYVDLDMTYLAADAQYNAQVDYGQLAHGAWNGRTARWWGFSALWHKRWMHPTLGRVGATARLDYLNNATNGGGGTDLYLGSADTPGTDPANGFGISPACYAADVDGEGNSNNGRNCKGANRFSLTSVFMLLPTDQWTIKAEYRFDWATRATFGTPGGTFRKSNDVISLQSVYQF